MQSRGLIPVDNVGDGNCVFMSLAQIVLGDSAKFEFIRYMVVQWLKTFPRKYNGGQNEFSDYCENMAMNGIKATSLELQVIADICFSVVECYAIQDFFVPFHTIRPLRFSKESDCPGRIRLWIQADHCVALVNRVPERQNDEINDKI